MKKVALFAAALSPVVLAGCTWFTNSPQNTSSTPGTETSNVQPSATDKVSTNSSAPPEGMSQLYRKDLGFLFQYPENVEVIESTTCTEGCPAGEAAPFFSFQTAKDEKVGFTAFRDERHALTILGISYSSFDDYVASGEVNDVQESKLSAGRVITYVVPGKPASTEPSLFGNDAQPDQLMTVLLANNGRTYTFRAANGEATPLVQSMLNTFE